MPGSSTTLGRMDTRVVVPTHVAFRQENGVGARGEGLSRLNGWPMHSPTDASPAPSREPAHGSGPMRFATPSSWRTFTTYSLPVSPAHHMPGSSTTPGRPDARAFAFVHIAFHLQNGVGTRDRCLSRLHGWPMHSPTDASPFPAHGSGPMRFATPSS